MCEVKAVTGKNIVQMSQYKDLEQLKIKTFKEEIIGSLSEDLMIKYYQLLNKKKTNCCPDIAQFFDINEIKQIIGNKYFV